MSSERKRLANQRNAQKSTGPKTEEGKAKSRRNALKHGLRGAGVVLRRQDEKKLAKRIEDWRETLAPVSPLEDTLVERAALAAVRCESAVRQEAAERRRRMTRALSRFECKKRKEIEAAVALLATQPGCAGRQLKELKRGVAWLIGEWKKLADQLEGHGFWTHEHAGLALRLLGKDPELPYPDHAGVLAFRKAFLGALPEVDLEEAEALLGLSAEGLEDDARQAAVNGQLPEPARARRFVGKIVARELKRLAQRRDELADDRDEALERAEALACVQIATDTHAFRLHRYEFTQEMSLHRNLNELIRIRKQEPELASIARWEKQGKKYNRRWDGYGWVPNSEWRSPAADDASSNSDAGVAGGEERVAGGGWRVAGGREGVSTEVEPSPVTGPEGEPRIDSEPQATPRVAGVSAWREPGASQPQLPPADPDPMAQEPVSASLADAGVGGWGSGVGGPGEVAGGGWRVAGGREGGSTEVEPSAVTGTEGEPRIDSESQAVTRVAGFSALREPGAPQPQLEPAGKPLTDGGDGMADRAPVRDQPSVVRHSSPDVATNEANETRPRPSLAEGSGESAGCLQNSSEAGPTGPKPPPLGAGAVG